MKNFKYLIGGVLCCALYCTSCTQTKSDEYPFPFDNFKSLQGEIICPNVFFSTPSRMYMVNSMLYVADESEGKLLSILNLNTSQVKRMVNYGEGPQDLRQIRTISYNAPNNEICFYDRRMKQMSAYLIDEDSLIFNVSINLRQNTLGYYDVLPFRNGYIGNGCFDHGEQFVWFGEDWDPVFFGEYPGDKTGIDVSSTFFLKTQTLLAVNPNQEYLAAAGVYDDQLVFFKHENNNFIQEKEYFGIDSKVETKYTKKGDRETFSSHLTPQTTDTYQYLYPTESYLYAIYWGITQEEEKETKNHQSYVLKFDWEGNLKDGYIVNGLISSMAVDEERECLYMIRWIDDDYRLMQYDIPH